MEICFREFFTQFFSGEELQNQLSTPGPANANQPIEMKSDVVSSWFDCFYSVWDSVPSNHRNH